MAVKIRLKRMGKVRQPYYRVVVVDSRKKRDGKVIEEIGKYHPKQEPSLIDLLSERAQYWLGVGAQPTEAVEALLKVTGDWQKFKGLPGSEGTLRTPEAKRDKAQLFNEALKDSAHEPSTDAVTTKKAAKKSTAKSTAKSAEGATEQPRAAAETAEPSAAADTAPPEPTPGDETPVGAAAEADTGEAQPPEADTVEERAIVADAAESDAAQSAAAPTDQPADQPTEATAEAETADAGAVEDEPAADDSREP